MERCPGSLPLGIHDTDTSQGQKAPTGQSLELNPAMQTESAMHYSAEHTDVCMLHPAWPLTQSLTGLVGKRHTLLTLAQI